MEKTTTRILPVPLTEEEKLELGNKIAELEIEIESIEADKKSDNDHYNSKIKSKSSEALSLSKELKAGTKDVEIDCEWYMNEPEEGKKTLKRLDTFEVVEITEMDLLDNENTVTDESYEVVDDTVNPESTNEAQNGGN